jgi:hypothetical protein
MSRRAACRHGLPARGCRWSTGRHPPIPPVSHRLNYSGPQNPAAIWKPQIHRMRHHEENRSHHQAVQAG